MTKQLELAFREAARLPESEQESFAAFLLAELREEAKWQSAFETRPDALEFLADEAIADHAEGRTKPLEDLFQ